MTSGGKTSVFFENFCFAPSAQSRREQSNHFANAAASVFDNHRETENITRTSQRPSYTLCAVSVKRRRDIVALNLEGKRERGRRREKERGREGGCQETLARTENVGWRKAPRFKAPGGSAPNATTPREGSSAGVEQNERRALWKRRRKERMVEEGCEVER